MTPVIKEEQMTTLEKKILNFSRILASRPGDELTVLALAEAAFRRGLKLEALTAYQEIGSRAVPEAHLAVAEIYSDQGMPHEAYGELRKLFELDPENVEARLLIHALQAEALPPEEMREILNTPISEEAIDEAKLRLRIQRSIYHKELQERTRNVTLEPGTVIHEYHMEEAKKKLIRVDELLRELDRFREHNASLLAEPPRPEVLSSHPEATENAVDPSEILSLEVPLDEDYPSLSLQVPPGLDELPEEFVEAVEEATVTVDDSLELAPFEPSGEDAELPLSLPQEEFETPSQPLLSLDPEDVMTSDVPALASYSSGEFALSVESPLDPDLPELEREEEPHFLEPLAPSMVDLEPIEMSAESSNTIALEMPELSFRESSDSPPVPEPVQVVMPMLDDSTMILTSSPEPASAQPVFRPTHPPLEFAAPDFERGPTSIEEESPRELSPARQSFYQAHAEALSGLTTTLARTRGVTSIFLVAREGVTIDAAAKDDISHDRVGELVRESFEFLEAFSKDPAYWVLECAGGIFVMQKLDERHVLIAIGQAGANFGALRYTMDKTRTKFEQVLAQVPE